MYPGVICSVVHAATRCAFAISTLLPGSNLKNLAYEEGKKRGSLHGRLPSLVRLVHRYYGTVRLLQYVHVRRAACGLRGPALIVRPRRTEDLPVLVHVNWDKGFCNSRLHRFFQPTEALFDRVRLAPDGLGATGRLVG